MLSNTCKYALRALIYLGKYSEEDKRIGIKRISEELGLSSPFLGKILQNLVKQKLLVSTKGPNGGFYLSKDNSVKTVCDIIENIDGLNRLNDCFLGLHECDGNNPCPVHFIVEPFKKNILGKFRDKTIVEFAKEISETGRVLTLKDISPKIPK